MAKKRTTVAKKGKLKKTQRRRFKKALPPPDNPLLRHEELDAARRIEGEEEFVAGAAIKAAIAAASGRRPSKPSKAKIKEGTTQKLAKLRLAALRHARHMGVHDVSTPTVVRARAISATDPGAIEMVPAAPGISNWVQVQI
jgi:hypothetical protein